MKARRTTLEPSGKNKWEKESMKFTICSMRTCPLSQSPGFFSMEPRARWIETKGGGISNETSQPEKPIAAVPCNAI